MSTDGTAASVLLLKQEAEMEEETEEENCAIKSEVKSLSDEEGFFPQGQDWVMKAEKNNDWSPSIAEVIGCAQGATELPFPVNDDVKDEEEPIFPSFEAALPFPVEEEPFPVKEEPLPVKQEPLPFPVAARHVEQEHDYVQQLPAVKREPQFPESEDCSRVLPVKREPFPVPVVIKKEPFPVPEEEEEEPFLGFQPQLGYGVSNEKFPFPGCEFLKCLGVA